MSPSGVVCISTSTGSSLGQILTGSSLGQTSFEGGQLGGCMEDSEPMGDHMMRGEGLVPSWGEKERLAVSTRRTASHCFVTYRQERHHWMGMGVETLVCLEYLPHHLHHRAESRNQRLKTLGHSNWH